MYNKNPKKGKPEDYSFLYADLDYATDTKKMCISWKKEQEMRLKKYYKTKSLNR
jgi:hypothetical protein